MTAPSAAPSTKATVPCAQCQTLNRVDLARLASGPRCAHCGTALALDHPLPVTDATFDRVMADSPVPVLVDFYADWCGPCRAMAPQLDAYAQRNAGTVLVAKVDTDRSPNVSQRFGIRSIPTLAVFVGGREAGREVGAVPIARLDALVARARGPQG
jgi:thioredoxin 2